MISTPIKRLGRLVEEIRDELIKLDHLFAEWKGIDSGYRNNHLVLRGRASILHDFYHGVELIFKRIGKQFGGVPSGESWQWELLNDMRLDIPGLRPPVISDETYKSLLEFLGFRHKFRNIYGFDLELEKVAAIEAKFAEAHSKVSAEVEAFLLFLENVASEYPSSKK